MRSTMTAMTAALFVGAAFLAGCARSGSAPVPPAPALQEASDPPASHAMPTSPSSLHDGAYAMTFHLGGQLRPGEATRLAYTPKTREGELVEDLEVSHDKLSHLIVVSRDLGFFEHVHPERQADGSFAMDYAFPASGDYVLFADFLPEGAGRAQVFAHPVHVPGPEPRPHPLGPTSTEATEAGLVAHLAAPVPLMAGQDVTLAFHLSDARGDVRDIEQFLGAGGHVVVIPEGAGDFLHVHPVVGEGHAGHGPTAPGHAAHAPPAHGEEQPHTYGPLLRFATAFPRPGRYKLWLQVQRAGRVHALPFVLDVSA
ncbi:MAG TPA: hypothetical protein VD962_12500 [Rubricoccaceae bacterium]|nr:hypothetical protein [Rubricoccaceae bacterium]